MEDIDFEWSLLLEIQTNCKKLGLEGNISSALYVFTLGPRAQAKLMIPMFSLPLCIFHYSCKQFESNIQTILCRVNPHGGICVFFGVKFHYFSQSYRELFGIISSYYKIWLTFSFLWLNFANFLYWVFQEK